MYWRKKLIPQKFFHACIGFVPGGSLHQIKCCDIVDHLQGSFGFFGPRSPKNVSKGVPGPLGPGGPKSQQN